MRQKVASTLYLGTGYFFLAVGIVGIFLPLLPTVPFLLLAAFCFSRGSEKMHRWLLDHPILGHPIKDWNERRVIRPRAKAFSAVMMIGGMGSVWYFGPSDWVLLKFILTVLLMSVIIFVLVQRSK